MRRGQASVGFLAKLARVMTRGAAAGSIISKHTLTPIFSSTLVCFSLICFSNFLRAVPYGAAPYVFSTWISLATD